MRKSLSAIAIASLMLAGGACTVSKQSTPGLSGPSELAMSVQMTATPDSLLQNGLGTSQVAVTVFDAGGNPISVAVQLSLSGAGMLSAGTLTTGTDKAHPAFVIYTPPVATSGSASVVTIKGTVIASNSVNNANTAQGLPVASPQVAMTIAPASAVAANAPAASFTALPFAPAQALTVGKLTAFDASASCGTQLVAGVCPGTSAIVSYSWNFGDGTPSVFGQIVSHTYTAAGTYAPRLTITNDKGIVASTTQTLVLAVVAAPQAVFNVSPAAVAHVTGTAFFNGVGSSAAVGHSILQNNWNYGDGNTATTSGPTTSHVYAAAGNYTSSLTLIDDLGQTSVTATATVTVN